MGLAVTPRLAVVHQVFLYRLLLLHFMMEHLTLVVVAQDREVEVALDMLKSGLILNDKLY
jgi:hypothetical protein